jgi:hypothetical protein
VSNIVLFKKFGLSRNGEVLAENEFSVWDPCGDILVPIPPRAHGWAITSKLEIVFVQHILSQYATRFHNFSLKKMPPY